MAERAVRRPPHRGRGRYVAPAVLCFLRHRDAVLLIEGSRRKRWAGKLQGIGGGLQAAEHPVRAVLREIHEETGLRLTAADVRVKGIVHSQNFYGASKLMVVAVARAPHRRARAGAEGNLRWVPLRRLSREPNLVPDLYTLIPRVFALRPGRLLAGVTVFDGRGGLLAVDLAAVRG